MNKIDRVKRRIKRITIQLKPLEDRTEHLSKYGYWDVGFLKGQLSMLEDLLDDLQEGILYEKSEK